MRNRNLRPVNRRRDWQIRRLHKKKWEGNSDERVGFEYKIVLTNAWSIVLVGKLI